MAYFSIIKGNNLTKKEKPVRLFSKNLKKKE